MKKNSYLPHIAYDSVVFGYSGEDLRILLLKYRNTGLLALPGGFVHPDEDLDAAVKRGLRERTGLRTVYLEQFHTFGSTKRFQPEVMRKILVANGINPYGNHRWMMDRFISVAYYALINYNRVKPQPDEFSDSCKWYAVKRLPRLILDHNQIVERALKTLRTNLDRKIVGMHLLPEQFTMRELKDVYEAFLGRKLHRSSFQRDMLATRLLKRHAKLYSGGAHKAPYLYSFRK